MAEWIKASIDFSHSFLNSLIISRAPILMKEVLLPQSVMVGSHTRFFYYISFFLLITVYFTVNLYQKLL